MAIIAALLLVYAGGMAINILRGRTHIDCGCLGFGTSRASLGWELVARNILLGAVALAVFALPVVPRALGAIDAISGLGAVVALALLYLGFGQFTAVRLQEKAVLK
jgi:ABC-type phosphate transport system permease subunit